MDHSALTPAAPRGASFRLPHPNRRTLVKGVAWSAPVLAVATSAPALAVSIPMNAQARAFLLSGSLGGLGLGGQNPQELVALNGVHAEAVNNTPVDEHTNPLTLDALNLIFAELTGLGGALSNILTLATDSEVGALNEYAYAAQSTSTPESAEIGGAGAVSSNGVIDFQRNGSGAPSLATLHLEHVLAQLTGNAAVTNLLDSVTDLTLDIGAVAGRAQMNVAEPVPDPSQVTREYLLAYLHLLVESDATGALATALTAGDPITIGVDTTALGNILPGTGVTATVTLNAGELTGSIPNDGDTGVSINLGEGRIDIDVAPLLGHAFDDLPNGSLNRLAPNTRLFSQAGLPAPAVTTLTDALAEALLDRLGGLVEVNIGLSVSLLGIGTDVSIEATLEELLNGQATFEPNPLGLSGLLTGTVLRSVGDLIRTALLTGSNTIGTALTAINGLLGSLFTVLGDPDILRLTVNAQNKPATGTGHVPSSYSSLTAGRFDVAALHLEVLGLADLLDVSLGRGSVGENTLKQ